MCCLILPHTFPVSGEYVGTRGLLFAGKLSPTSWKPTVDISTIQPVRHDHSAEEFERDRRYIPAVMDLHMLRQRQLTLFGGKVTLGEAALVDFVGDEFAFVLIG